MGVAKIASSIASKEIFCYGRNFFLTVRSGFNRFMLCYEKKLEYARSVHIKPAPDHTFI